MKYTKFTGIILKKQNYREADQIVTIWTREAGKVRVMARGLRSNKSKLAYSAQDLSLVEFEAAGRKALPALISCKAIKNFPALREDLGKTVAGLYAAELILKMTPDEEPNPELFGMAAEFLDFIEGADFSRLSLFSAVDCFALRLMRNLGFSFENARDSFRLPQSLDEALQLLMECDYRDLTQARMDEAKSRQSHEVVKNFIEFVLERSIKSEQFLTTI